MESTSDHQTRAPLTCTIQSHGAKVARFHLYDWLVLVALAVLEGLLQLAPPYKRFVSKHMMDDLRYPFRKHNTIPIWSVPVFAALLPIIIFTVHYFRRRNVYDLHNATLALLYAVGITAVITDAVKNAVGRPRPNFFWRCFPDGNEKYDSVGNAICDGVESVIREGHRSFPSGHSSVSFAGLAFLSLYLCGKMRVFDHKGHVAKLSVVSLPLLGATFVAISRVDDYWHHWQDVFVGGLLGIVVACLCYHQFYPPPNHPNGQEPYGFLAAVEDQVRINGEEKANVVDELMDGSFVDPEAQNHRRQITHDSNDPKIQNHRRHEIDDTNGPSESKDDDLEARIDISSNEK